MRCLKQPILMLAIFYGIVGCGSLSQAATNYDTDLVNHVITIHNTGNASADVNQALTYLINRTDKTTQWMVKFDPGSYYLTQTFYGDRLQNVALVSDPTKPAKIIKPDNFACEYLLVSRFSKNLTIQGFEFYGNTRVFNPANYETTDYTSTPVWKDQGIYLGSTNGVTLTQNRFYDFGNGALRISTAETDPVPGVDSFNSQVTQNYFNNVFQVTTTSNDTIHGGSAGYLFQGNIFENLRGSLKFASRTPGATNVYIRYNEIRSSSTDGLEVVGYNNLEVSDNQFRNIARNTINCYSNGRSGQGFAWGDKLVFKNNTIDSALVGIRFSADPFGDGFQPAPQNVEVSGNAISNITGTSPAVMMLNGTFPALSITSNKFSNITSKKYIMVQKPLSDMVVSGNTIEGSIMTALK